MAPALDIPIRLRTLTRSLIFWRLRWSVICCAIIGLSYSLTIENALGQSVFRPSTISNSSAVANESRLAQQPSGERPEYQFPTRSSLSQPSGFVEQGQFAQPGFAEHGLLRQEMGQSPLSGEVFGLGTEDYGQGFSSGHSPDDSQTFQAFIPKQEPTSGDVEPRAMSFEEAMKRYGQTESNSTESNSNESNSIQSNANEYSSTVYDAYQPLAQDDDIETMPPPLVDSSDETNQDGLEVVVQRYPNGRPRIIRHVAQDADGNYFNHGPWQVRTENGKPVADGSYKKGMMDGQWRREHAADSSGLFDTRPFDLFQGPYLSVARFSEGKLEGVWTIYDRNRTKIFEMPYKKGVRDGVATWFLPDQAKMREATFKDGLIDGEILEYKEDKVVKRDQYVEGRKIVRNTSFYRPDVKRSEEYYLASKLEPEAEDNWWEAKPTPFLSRGTETQNGPSMSWYENGQPKKRGQFKDGQPVGQFTWWHANGNKRIEGFYEEGQKSRRWTWWYENGFKQFEGTFEDDFPSGVWRAWFDDGQLRTEKDYSASDESSQEPETESADASESANEQGMQNGEFETDPFFSESNSVVDPFSNEAGEASEMSVESETESLPTPPANEPVEGNSSALPLEEITPKEGAPDFREPKIPGEETGNVSSGNEEAGNENLGSEGSNNEEAGGEESNNDSIDDEVGPIKFLDEDSDAIGEIPLDEPATTELNSPNKST